MKLPPSERAAARPRHQPLTHQPARPAVSRRRRQPKPKPRSGSLTLRVTLPARAVPLFHALAAATEAASPEAFAAWCVCRGLVSDEAMAQFDQLVNDLL